jgi:short subunit dehydrogenase-like uncharacterized protein
MPDVLLFGATGYTGALTARALARRGAETILAGRNPSRLEALASEVDARDIAVVEVGDVGGLATALEDVKAIVTCVGPFTKLGHTAVEAALQAGVHYVDSTGEISFVSELIDRYDTPARERGIVMAPALGFDEVPSDVALSLTVDGLPQADAVVTYSLPGKPSMGTVRTIVAGIGGGSGGWIREGRVVEVATGQHSRWSPMPPPIGPTYAISMPFSEGRLAPLHLDVRNLELYGAVGQRAAVAMRVGAPFMRALSNIGPAQQLVDRVLEGRRGGPDEVARRKDRWAFLAEARSADGWRNVSLSGVDPYGLTAETLAAGALKLARDGHGSAGVIAPVQTLGLETWHKELIDLGVDIQVYEPS